MATQGTKPAASAQPAYKTESPFATNLRQAGTNGNLDKVIGKGIAAVKQEPLDAKPGPITYGHHAPPPDGIIPGGKAFSDKPK